LGFFGRSNNDPSIVLMTTEHQPVSFSISAPGVGYYSNRKVSAGNEIVVYLPDELIISSPNNGIYIHTNSSKVTVIGQSIGSGGSPSDTYIALPIKILFTNVYTYYGILAADNKTSDYSVVLVVGTANNTTIKLAVTQSATITVGSSTYTLTPQRQYIYVIDRLQTVYITSYEDLSGTKIVTNEPVSVFSGHTCLHIPNSKVDCGQLIEQIPPTTLWGKVYYTAPLVTRRSYTIKVLAAYNSTNVEINCNGSRYASKSYIINEGISITKTLLLQEYCAVYSNKEVMVVQFSHGQGDDPPALGDPMNLLPFTTQMSLASPQFVIQ